MMVAIGLFFLLSGCHRYHNSSTYEKVYEERKNEPEFTVSVRCMECTECLDAYIEQGTVIPPKDLKGVLGDTLKMLDIILVGNFPFDLIDNRGFNDHWSNFKITGKLIGTDSNNFVSDKAPVFYVSKWEKIKPRN